MKKKIASAAVAGILLGGTGVASVISMPMAALAADSTTAASAESTARTPAQWAGDALKGLVDKGTISQEQSDAVSQALAEAKPEKGFGGGRGGGGPMASAKAAEVLGVSQEDIHTAMHDGKSLADLAKEKNVELQKLIDALVAEETTRIDQAVTDGRLTQEQADTKKAKVAERVTDRVNNVRPTGGPGGGFGRGGDVAPAPAPAA